MFVIVQVRFGKVIYFLYGVQKGTQKWLISKYFPPSLLDNGKADKNIFEMQFSTNK